MLRTALGPSIAAWLDDAAVIEVMLDPDELLWIDRLGEGSTAHSASVKSVGKASSARACCALVVSAHTVDLRKCRKIP